MNKNSLILTAVIVLVVVWFAYKLAQKVGLADTQADVDTNKLLNADFWSKSYYKQFKGKKPKLLEQKFAQKLVNTLWDAGSFYNDDEQKMYGVFRQLSTKTELSHLSDWFFNLKGQDLAQYLNNHLNSDEMKIIYDIVNKYKTK